MHTLILQKVKKKYHLAMIKKVYKNINIESSDCDCFNIKVRMFSF